MDILLGAEGELRELFKILDHDCNTLIEVYGHGWKNALLKNIHWDEYIQNYTMTVKCNSVIRDNSSDIIELPFWAS